MLKNGKHIKFPVFHSSLPFQQIGGDFSALFSRSEIRKKITDSRVKLFSCVCAYRSTTQIIFPPNWIKFALMEYARRVGKCWSATFLFAFEHLIPRRVISLWAIPPPWESLAPADGMRAWRNGGRRAPSDACRSISAKSLLTRGAVWKRIDGRQVPGGSGRGGWKKKIVSRSRLL